MLRGKKKSNCKFRKHYIFFFEKRVFERTLIQPIQYNINSVVKPSD